MTMLRYAAVAASAMILGLTLSVAQGQPTPEPDTYAKMVAYKVTAGAKHTRITLDFGDQTGASASRVLRDEMSGKAEKFNSEIDALNYMAQAGWVVQGGYVLSADTGNPTYVYLLRKPGQ